MSSLFIIMLFISIIMIVLHLMLFYNNTSLEKQSAFECGFEPLSEMRTPFSLRFFILVILFLIFDIEISLLFPIISISTLMLSLFMKTSLFIFLIILLIGLFHEWNEGAIDWMSMYLS
uniref:NADH-ubiquinone oxidoreductase chain 3 n=1 Tax=Biomphalaria pfeifferi TaxID=112525 RepID=A0A2U8J9G9_BIOPF|nr:NADH dehydrogenase subunit 3 [Biomphalaria pfeifferi]AWK49464.1 NADH dehydrogenase subunit 3 [Biomphalaria pfeifferi]